MEDPQIIKDLRDVIENGYRRIHDTVTDKKYKVDSYTANAIVKVYDQLNDSNKQKYSGLSLLKMQEIAFKFVK